jgi:hypothetical protein
MRLKRVLGLGILAGIVYALWRAWSARVPANDRAVEWQSSPFPFPPVPRPRVEVELAGFLDAGESGSCPATHPIKAKMSSGIYHVPGGANYERTHADRCYVDAAAAEADGLRKSKV